MKKLILIGVLSLYANADKAMCNMFLENAAMIIEKYDYAQSRAMKKAYVGIIINSLISAKYECGDENKKWITDALNVYKVRLKTL